MTKCEVDNELDFVSQIGHSGEPAGTCLVVELARDFWTIWPKISIANSTTKCSVAENNVRVGLRIINEFDGHPDVNQEQLMLAAINHDTRFVEGVDQETSEFQLVSQCANLRTVSKTRANRQIDQLAAELTHVRRDMLLSSTHWEDDSEHTLTTALIAWKVASKHAPELNIAEIIKMALVHELTETITGDVSSFNLSKEQLEEKGRNDTRAAQKFAEKYADCPKLVKKFLEYENKETPEALFVYWIDKIMPGFPTYHPIERTHFLAPSREIYEHDGSAHPGRNGNRKTIAKWHQNTKTKLLAAGQVPHPICEELLAQGLRWLEWLVENHVK
ncbi:HD domain-containing protein [Candidatus Saccharibacteria bacterium]|nr:HD domain-containing protein [Candidatus Saccharibacteria bacterium]